MTRVIRASRARQLTRGISWVLSVAGLLMLLDAGLTLVWQEPLTAVVAMVRQDSLDRQYLDFRRIPLSTIERHALRGLADPDKRIAFLARREAQQVPAGAAIGRLVIPKLGVADYMAQGADPATLQQGPGHYPASAFPGLGRTVAIAGHRTTYLAPFRRIDRLSTADRIVLQMPYGTFTYSVQYRRVVGPGAWWITRNVGYERLILSACTPLFSAADRIVVFARLVGEKPTSAIFPR